MPFRTGQWQGNRFVPAAGSQLPHPELRQETTKAFFLLKTFCYEIPAPDPDAGTIVVIVGTDAPGDPSSEPVDGHPVLIPPNSGGRTDLASVPPFFWWLVASYGNHTRAALLHDALIPNDNEAELVPGTTADRLLLTALREPGPQKAGAIRHWFMWAAVSLGRTMPKAAGAMVVLQALFAWTVLLVGIALVWLPGIWPDRWSLGTVGKVVVAALAAIAVSSVVVGMIWRAAAGRPAQWLLAMVPFILVTLATAWRAWGDDRRLFWFLIAAAVLAALGYVWGFGVDPTLRLALWPTAFVGVPVAGLPLFPIFLAIGIVWLVDVGASLAASWRKNPDGSDRSFELPSIGPLRTPLG